MKIQSLKLERFGHFQGATLDFTDGLQLLYGRNEAGKSTLAAALRALLFQMPRGAYDFRFAESTLAVWARLAFADGAQAEIRREKHKGYKGQLDGDKLTDEQFKERLGRPSQELFANVFAFGLEELARGADSIKDAGLGAALSGAAVGAGVGPDVLFAELKEQADALFTERARKAPIVQLVGDIREGQKKLRESELRGDKFLALESAFLSEKTRADELRQERESVLRRISLVESALRALPATEKLAGARLARQRLGTVTPLPASAESEFQQKKSERERLAARLVEIESKLGRTRSELQTLVSDEKPSDPLDARLASLCDAWSGHLERREQLEAAHAERARLLQEKTRLRARLDPPWSANGDVIPVPRVEEVRRQKSILDKLLRAREEAARDRDRAARELQQAEEQAAQKAGDAPSPDELARLRRERDALWDKIRKSWLEGALTGGEGSGELFRVASEKQLATSLTAAVNAADQYADEMRRRATDVAAAKEAATRRDERARAVQAADSDLAQAASALSDGEKAWQALWERCSFLPQSPEAMLEWLADYHGLREGSELEEAALDRCTRLQKATSEYESQLRAAVGGDAAIEELYARGKKRLHDEAEREQQRIRDSERRRHLSHTLDDLAHEQRTTQTQLTALQSELAAWRTRAAAADDDAFAAAAAVAREAHELEREIVEAERTLAEVSAGVAAADLEAALGRGGEPLKAERIELAETRSRLEAELDETARRVGAAENELKKLDGRSQSLEQLAILEGKRAELRDRATEWARLTLAKAMLERQMARFSAQQQPRLIESVSRLFAGMTRGRYAKVAQQLDGFVAVRTDGTEVKPEALSTGTREQLYLAVRLAYIDSYCARAEPLPLCLDDVLVNFDDDRAAATLDVLGRFAAEGRAQVLFLTCHAHLVELAKRVLPSLKPTELPAVG